MKLYEIDQQIQRCVKLEDEDGYVDTETGEVLDAEAMDALEMARDEKVENLMCWYKNLQAEAKAVGDEMKALAARKKRKENLAESVKGFLGRILDGKKFETAKGRISWRSSETVVCNDMTMVPDDYLRYKDPELDKAKIKAAIKAGTDIPGCSLQAKNNVVIK